MKRPATLFLFLALFAPLQVGIPTGTTILDGLEDATRADGIEREGDIPLP